MASLVEDLESDSSEEEWVISSINETKQKAKQKEQHQQKIPATNNYSRNRPSLSAASFRMARAYLPSPSSLTPFQPSAAAIAAITKTKPSTPSPSLSPAPAPASAPAPSPSPPPPTTRSTAALPVQSKINNTSACNIPAPSSTHISNEELIEICTHMDDNLLVTRLVNVYKSVEIYIRIREIETGSVIESRLKDYLHYCDNPCDFILVNDSIPCLFLRFN